MDSGWLTAEIFKRAIARILDWLAKLRASRLDHRILEGKASSRKLDFRVVVPERLRELLGGTLPPPFDKPALREWLSNPRTSDALAELFARNPDAPEKDCVPWRTLEQTYQEHTGESGHLATGYIELLFAYLKSCLLGGGSRDTPSPVLLAAEILRRLPPSHDAIQLRARALEPARKILSRAKVRWHFPDHVVPVRMTLRDQGERSSNIPRATNFAELIQRIRKEPHLTLVGEAGAGKTTLLVTLCEALLDEPDAPVPLYVDAATWAASDKGPLEYIAALPIFADSGLQLGELAHLNEEGRLLFVFNGWNEVSIARQADANFRMQGFLDGSSKTHTVVTTRSVNDFAGLPDCTVIEVRGFSWEEQRTYILASLPAEPALVLIRALKESARLRSVTKNPLVLSGVVSLRRDGRSLPDNLYDLFEAIVVHYEGDPTRARALRGAPLRGAHGKYLEAMAAAMNTSGGTVLSDSDARAAIGAISRNLEEHFGQSPDPTDVLDALCGQHLLHREHDWSVRFAHQRFQEYFSARVVLERLSAVAAGGEAEEVFRQEIVNWPFWQSAMDLVAEREPPAGGTLRTRDQLIRMALPVDLAYAAYLFGIAPGAPQGDTSWSDLAAAIDQIQMEGTPEAQRYALLCATATRSSYFAPLVWPLLEHSDQQVRLNGYRLFGGLTLLQLGPDAAERIAGWPEERRVEAVWEFAARQENFEEIRRVAETDPTPEVRGSAIAALNDYYDATEAALKAWYAAPDNVKQAKPALRMALDLWHAGDHKLTAALLDLARASTSADIRSQIGLALLSEGEEIALDAAKRALTEDLGQRPVKEGVVDLLRMKDSQFLKGLAIQRIADSGRISEWVIDETLMWSAEERDGIALQVLETLSASDHATRGLEIFAGVSAGLIAELLSQGIELSKQLRLRQGHDAALSRRYGALQRALAHTDASKLAQAILLRTSGLSYDEASWCVLLLDQRVSEEEGSSRSAPMPWRPNIGELDQLIAASGTLNEQREIPTCELEAHLASLAAKTDSSRYSSFILSAAKAYAAAYFKYDLANQRWVAERQRGPRPSNPPYGMAFIRALRRCGFAVVPSLLSMMDEPGADHIVFDALVTILAAPWEERLRTMPILHGSYNKDGAHRRSLGRVFLQPDDTLQPLTDEVARVILRKFEAMDSSKDGDRQIDYSRPSAAAHAFWQTCTALARVPSPLVRDVVHKIVMRGDITTYPFLSVAQALVSQGARLPAEALETLERLWATEVANGWLDETAQFRLAGLASLFFHVEPVHESVARFEELRAAWIEIAHIWRVVETLLGVGTREALETLVKLLPQCEGQSGGAERIIRAVAESPLAEMGEMLVELVATGAVSRYFGGAFFVEREVESRLRAVAELDAGLKERLIATFQTKTDPRDERIACSVLGQLDDPRARDFLIRFLDESAYPGEGRSTTYVLLGQFQLEAPARDNPGWYEIYPRANNELRRRLFSLAAAAGSSRRRARAVLLELEERRFGQGRPADEPRHPAIETKAPWPLCLFS